MNSPAIPHGALVVVGDGTKVLFLRNHGTPFEPRLAVEDVLTKKNPPTREQGTDKPGRYSGHPGTTPESGFDNTDWHQLAEDRFAADVADTLYRLVHAHRVDDIVVVAPPRVLGVLRKTLHKEVSARVRAEIPKELTSHTLPDIEKLLTQ
jgi:protein required for attachment to host cells